LDWKRLPERSTVQYSRLVLFVLLGVRDLKLPVLVDRLCWNLIWKTALLHKWLIAK
jgi:hypothetical protein